MFNYYRSVNPYYIKLEIFSQCNNETVLQGNSVTASVGSQLLYYIPFG